MSDEILGQYTTLIGSAAIPKSLLAVPIPTEDDAGKVFTAGEDGSVKWKEPQKLEEAGATDALVAMTESGIIAPIQQDGVFYISPEDEIYVI